MKRKSTLKIAFRKSTPYVFILPVILLIACFLVYPLITVFQYSLQSYDITKISEQGFVGPENFKTLFGDELFYKSIWVSVKWVIIQVVAQLILGLLLALMLDRKFKGRGLYRTIVFFPWAVSGVLTSMLWSLIYNENIGVLNALLKQLNLIEENIAWLGDTNLVFGAVCVAEIWRGIPFFAITILAALQNIPGSLHESCVIDGGNIFQEIFYVKIPMIKNTIILTTLLRSVWEFNNVDLIFTLTGGGPANATTTLTMYMTNMAVKNGNYGYGSTLAVAAFVILLIFAVIYLTVSGFNKEEE